MNQVIIRNLVGVSQDECDAAYLAALLVLEYGLESFEDVTINFVDYVESDTIGKCYPEIRDIDIVVNGPVRESYNKVFMSKESATLFLVGHEAQHIVQWDSGIDILAQKDVVNFGGHVYLPMEIDATRIGLHVVKYYMSGYSGTIIFDRKDNEMELKIDIPAKSLFEKDKI